MNPSGLQAVSVVGISHHTAPVAVREAAALSETQVRSLLRRAHTQDVLDEAMVLSTCNRTEAYVVRHGDQDPLAYILDQLAHVTGARSDADPSRFYRYDGAEAVRHLFRVAGGLDSQMVGEHEILAQVKRAYRAALDAQNAKFLLNKLLHWTFRVGKRIRTATDLGSGSVSLPQAAVEAAQRSLGGLSGKNVLLIGAGEAAQLAAKAALRLGPARIVVAGRTLDRAREVAEGLGRLAPKEAAAIGLDGDEEPVRCPALLRAGQTARFDPPAPVIDTRLEPLELIAIAAVIGQMDLVVASAAAETFVLTAGELADPIRRAGRPMVLVDLGVPRNIDPALGELADVTVINLDDLNETIRRTLTRRHAGIPKAEAIVDEEVSKFLAWFGSLEAAPTIRLLQKRFTALGDEQFDRHGRKFGADHHDEVADYTRALSRRILHYPISFLQDLSAEASLSERLAAVDMIRRMFDLGELEPAP